jgi:hypothetical protein
MSLSRASTVIGLAIVLVLGITAYGLFHDMMDGFAWVRGASSWQWAVGGLFVGGLFSLALEATFEWLWEPDRSYITKPPRRLLKATAAGLILGVLVILLVWLALFGSA